jgi:PTH1 family peptidyl-tRNA hydrolase
MMTETTPGLALIVGLGNPGSEYAGHRHNVGFQVVDALAQAHGLAFVRRKAARARVAEGRIGDRPALLAKPRTFMNLSGRAVGRLSRAHEIPPERILVVYDDLDLPLGRLRLRPEGGSGGHMGMRSIIDALGSQAFPRLRVGIDRPPGGMDAAEYVLQPFVEEDQALVNDALERAAAAIECWLVDGIVVAMDRFNRPPDLPSPDVAEAAHPQPCPELGPEACPEAAEGSAEASADGPIEATEKRAFEPTYQESGE